MKFLNQIFDLADKKVFLRTDFDVAVKNNNIEEPLRILKQKKTIDYLVNHGAQVFLVAHISSVDSFSVILGQIETLLGRKIAFIPDIDDLGGSPAALSLLENIRRFDGETSNDDEFARQLANGFDIYVNNDFAVCHRRHASVAAITEFLPSFAGFLIKEETDKLKEVIAAPAEGKVVIIGGAKASTKVPVIRNFFGKAEAILLGGVVANDVLKEKGVDIADSMVDENTKDLLFGVDFSAKSIVAPFDFHISGNKIMDIGSKTAGFYAKIISQAKTIIWNGPMGVFENEEFAAGTRAVAEAVAASAALKVAGGGDTISAVNHFGLLDKIGFVSTGGGAMLEFLTGKSLPGLGALENSKYE